MAEKPILFNTEMARAILDGRKTQTRRLVKRNVAPVLYDDGIPTPDRIRMNAAGTMSFDWSGRVIGGFDLKMPCKPGDVLYVRETWADIPETAPGNLHYRADATQADLDWFREEGWKWRPSIHMPKEAARLFLRVTGVRCERLQDITPEDCANDGGFEPEAIKAVGIAPLFGTLWDSTIKKGDLNRYGWAANPWVWVIEFERCEKP